MSNGAVLPMLKPLAAAAVIGPIEFQNQQALPIRSLTFLPVDGRPHPISGSMVLPFKDLLSLNKF